MGDGVVVVSDIAPLVPMKVETDNYANYVVN